MKKYDIIVAGGGFAGIGAALSASRQGKTVLLIEQSGALGGAANNCLVMPFMPYSTTVTGADGKPEKLELVQGIFKTIVEKLKKMGQLSGGTFNVEYLKVVLDRMTKEFGVDVLFHSTLISVCKKDRKICSASVSTVAGITSFEADYFIDCTGDANLSALAGCDFQLGRQADNLCQPMTLCFRISNVSWDSVLKYRPEIQALYKKYREDGRILNPREDVLMFKQINKNAVHFNSTRVVKLNPIDPYDLSRAEMEAREQMLELFNFLKSNFEPFKDSDIVVSAASIGVRESRMVAGEHVLTGDELIKTTKFSDAVAAGNYDIDIHNPEGTGTSHYYFPEGQYYTIPYRSLVAKDFDNLLIAGRCISCDHEAQASIRIMPICCAIGEAAGVGAATALDKGCAAKDADIKSIQETLKQNNAFF